MVSLIRFLVIMDAPLTFFQLRITLHSISNPKSNKLYVMMNAVQLPVNLKRLSLIKRDRIRDTKRK